VIEGRYFDGLRSTPHPAQVEIGADRIVRVRFADSEREAPLAAIAVSDRLGSTPRRLRFDDDAVFETSDNDGVDRALALVGHRHFSGHVARWEGRWRIAIGSVVAVVLIAVLFIRFGVPLMASAAARLLPASVDRAISMQGLELLDRTMLGASTLPPKRQQALRDRFDAMTRPLNDGHIYKLELREGGPLKANAFALPDGTIVMTDELVKLSQNDDELVAVLAHEIGHVRGRHALRMLLQASGVAAITLAVYGDVASTSALAASIPTVLINAKHSRQFEQEADIFAKQWLHEHNIPEQRFDDMLCRLEQSSPSGDELKYLRSHPATDERAHCKPGGKADVRK
jgi:Zn-dependent protease with chaperone function